MPGDDQADETPSQRPGKPVPAHWPWKALVEQALEQGDAQKAGKLLEERLKVDVDDPNALLLLVRMLVDGDKYAIAHPAVEKLARVRPDAESWMLLGACEAALQRPDKALKALHKAHALAPDDGAIMRVMAAAYVDLYNFHDAEKWAMRSLEREDHHQAHVVLGFCALHARDWGRGWDEYAHGMGVSQHRDRYDYGLPDYAGRGSVLVYAEQGLGDQIAFCSALGDGVRQVVCHPKLETLLARSLPCEVYGSQFQNRVDWPVRAQSQISMSGLMRYTRRKMFHVEPYLRVHPEKALQWRALLQALGNRPKIGIAWTGGVPGSSGWRTRNLTLGQLAPLLGGLDVDWICLEYRDRGDEIAAYGASGGVRIHDWHWATRTTDYDDTAALVACLDAVVCVPTTVYHLAGGLGVPCHVIVHDKPHYHEGVSGGCPWWGSVTFHRRPELGDEGAISSVAEALCGFLSESTRDNH